MKVQVIRSAPEFETIDIKFPLYSYIQEDESEIFTKITEKHFLQFIIQQDGHIEISKHRSNPKYIQSIWIDNPTDWKHFQDALRSVKSYLKDF